MPEKHLKKTKGTRMTFRLEEELRERVEAAAKKHGVTAAAIVRRCIELAVGNFG